MIQSALHLRPICIVMIWLNIGILLQFKEKLQRIQDAMGKTNRLMNL